MFYFLLDLPENTIKGGEEIDFLETEESHVSKNKTTDPTGSFFYKDRVLEFPT